MIKNYFKIALRNLLRYKTFTAINILGLAIGMASCLLILLSIISELGYDSFHDKADRIVRVVFRGSIQGGTMNEAHVMPPVAAALKADYPEVEQATRIRKMGNPKVIYENSAFRDKPAAFADANFFQVFTFPLIQGDPAQALKEPHTIVISASTAQSYFKGENPIGKELLIGDDRDLFTVTGVMADMPVNSHFHFDLLASMATFPPAQKTLPGGWCVRIFIYLLLSTRL